MTFCVEICPSPIAANRLSALEKLSSSATPTSALGVNSVVIGRLRLRMARVSSSRPSSMASVRRSLENHWRILFRAFGLLTKLSQSREGPAVSDLEVRISTVSPLSSVVSSGTKRPLTRAPMVRWPTSVCTAYAKSTGVACAGSETILPFGVHTDTPAAPTIGPIGPVGPAGPAGLAGPDTGISA